MRRTIGAALATIGLVIALMAIAMATIWKPSGVVTASADADTPFITTEAGVLDLVAHRVKVTAESSDDATVTLAFGTVADTQAWIDGLSATRITGLKTWETLSTDSAQAPETSATADASATAEASATPAATDGATAEAATEIDPAIGLLAESDMWSKVVTGAGTVSTTVDISDSGNLEMIAASSDGTAPRITLTWDKEPNSRATVPVLLLGIVIGAVGIGLLMMQYQSDRREEEKREARKRRVARKASRAAAETSVITKFDGDITDTSRHIQTAATGHALGAGVFAASPRASQLRDRPLPEEARLLISDPDSDTAGAVADARAEHAADADRLAETGNAVSTQDSESAHTAGDDTAGGDDTESTWRKRWGLGRSAVEEIPGGVTSDKEPNETDESRGSTEEEGGASHA